MTASPFDSAIYRDLFTDIETARLFTDTAELRAMLLVWGALAAAQAKHELIPETAAKAIQRAAMEIQIDPAALAAETKANGVVVPALLRAFRDEMKAPEHAAFVHFGATSQDIIDTGLSLRLRQAFALASDRLKSVLTSLVTLADGQADTPIAARTWGQIATPTSFGGIVASWGFPLLSLAKDAEALPDKTFLASLSGAAGTLSALHPKGAMVRAEMARGLGLSDPGHSWHSARESRLRYAGWMAQTTVQLAKIGEDLILMAGSSQQEISLDGTGASSTMPNKQNPVQPALLKSLAAHSISLNAAVQSAGIHREQRDGAAWMTEWLSLSQLCCAFGKSLAVADELIPHIRPNQTRMYANLVADGGAVFAEALVFHLTQSMPRPEAQDQVKAMCTQARETGAPLQDIARHQFPDQDLSQAFEPNLGEAPTDARAFAKAVREMK